MQQLILEILREIELDKEYIKLCNEYCDFEGSYNVKIKEAEPIIQSFDSNFKYISSDKVFLKEITFQELTVRFFIGFQGGIVDFAYLVWKEGDNDNFHQGRFASLSEEINSEFEEKVKYQTPIATSLSDFEKILSKYFELFEAFKERFEAELQS